MNLDEIISLSSRKKNICLVLTFAKEQEYIFYQYFSGDRLVLKKVLLWLNKILTNLIKCYFESLVNDPL